MVRIVRESDTAGVPATAKKHAVSAQGRRLQVGFAKGRGLSERRACALIGVARSSLGYKTKMPAKDAPAVKVMHELSSQYPRYGYRRIHVFLSVVQLDRTDMIGQIRRPSPLPLPAEAAAEQEALYAEHDALCDSEDEHDEETLAKIDALSDRIDELVCTGAYDGEVEIVRGVVRPEDDT